MPLSVRVQRTASLGYVLAEAVGVTDTLTVAVWGEIVHRINEEADEKTRITPKSTKTIGLRNVLLGYAEMLYSIVWGGEVETTDEDNRDKDTPIIDERAPEIMRSTLVAYGVIDEDHTPHAAPPPFAFAADTAPTLGSYGGLTYKSMQQAMMQQAMMQQAMMQMRQQAMMQMQPQTMMQQQAMMRQQAMMQQHAMMQQAIEHKRREMEQLKEEMEHMRATKQVEEAIMKMTDDDFRKYW